MGVRLDEHVAAAVMPPVFQLAGRPYRAMTRELERVQALDAEQVAEVQLQRLRSLVKHCYESVPYYRELFDRIGVAPADIRSLEDYAKLPTLDKQTLKERPSAFVASNFSEADLVRVSSAGSTGVPTQPLQSQEYIDWGWCTFLRNVGWTGHLPGEREAWFVRPASKTVRRRMSLAFQRRWVVGVQDQSEASVARWAKRLAEFEPRFIYGYPSAIEAMARYATDHGMDIPSVAQVMCTSETLLPRQRALFAEAFGADVFNQYGSTEIYSLASECRHGSMHVNSDVNVVEFSRSEETGDRSAACEIIATPLFNFAMPLLRYRLGDIGDGVDGSCECGLPFPRMRLDTGRISDIVTFSDGRAVSSGILDYLVQDVPGIARFQFRQTSPDTLELLIVKCDTTDGRLDAGLANCEAEFEKRAGFHVDVHPRFVEDIPLTAAGKHRYVIPYGAEAPESI